MPSKTPITNFYKEIDVLTEEGETRKHTLFDYYKIWQDEAPIFLIISERGAKGKSTQAKWLAKEIWDDDRLRTMWIMNTVKLIDKEKKSHLTKPKQLLDNFQGSEKVERDVALADSKDKESWYTKFASLSTAETEKGSRDDFGLLVYDEFNVGLTNIKNQQVDLLSSLIGTLSDPVNTATDKFRKMIIHGNFKSLNNQLLIDLGVHVIKDEVTDVYVGDFLLMRILSPIMDENDRNEIKENNKNNWKYLLQEKLGKADHVYFNENLFDDINNVNTWMITLPITSKWILKIKKQYFRASIRLSQDLGKVLYFEPIDKSEADRETIFAIDKKSVEEGVIYNVNIKKSFIRYLAADMIYFQTGFVREQIIAEVTK